MKSMLDIVASWDDQTISLIVITILSSDDHLMSLKVHKV